MEVRKAEASDLAVLNGIYLDAMRDMHSRGIDQWDEGYPVGHLPEDIQNGDLFVLTEGGRVIGALALNDRMDDWHAGLNWHGGDERAMYVHRLVVAVSERGKGYAKQTMLWAHQYAHEQGFRWIHLDTHTANKAAVGLYHSLGYTDVGRLNGFPEYVAMDCLIQL